MGLFSRRSTDHSARSCPHDAVDPRWDAMRDVGHKECIDHYVCRHCSVRIEADHSESADAES